MRKYSLESESYHARRHRKDIAWQIHRAHSHKHWSKYYKRLRERDQLRDADFYETRALRGQKIKDVYKKKGYSKHSLTIDIDREFGIEKPDDVDYFLNIAENIIDFDTKHLYLNFSSCNRVWPSGITLLCSLKQWTELKSYESQMPTIGSSPSSSDKVNSYLGHCGFYDYVGRGRDTDQNYYKNQEIVKIKREKKRSNPEDRETQITNLLRQYSLLSENEIIMFDSIILTEVFNNATEHGISKSDAGWWILAQYHQAHKFISLSVADNGIGIRNSLMTGPQRNEVGKVIHDSQDNDGEFIIHALTENVSGALAASTKTGYFFKRYDSGSRRGHGLKRIRTCCSKLNIPFAILSHYGYTFINGNGEITNKGAKHNRVFAGTMYHFIIRTK